MTSAAAHPASGQKRMRDATPGTAAESSLQDAELIFALFLAPQSPQPKLVRTSPGSSLVSVSSSSSPSAPSWSSLAADLLTCVCLFLSSSCELLQLSRVHRCFDAVIRSEAAVNRCWLSARALQLKITAGGIRVNNRRINLPSHTENAAPQEPAAASAPLVSLLSSPSSSSPPSLPASSLPSAVRRVMASLPHCPAGTGPALCFLHRLRFVPRLRYCGEPTLVFAASLSWSRQLRCLTLNGRTDTQGLTVELLNAGLRSLPALRSLSLGCSHRYPIAPETLRSLPLLHLELRWDSVQLYRMLSAEPDSPLCQSLRSLRVSRIDVRCLTLLPSLQHWHAGASRRNWKNRQMTLPASPAVQLARLRSLGSGQELLDVSLVAVPCPSWLQLLRCLSLQLDGRMNARRTLQLLSGLSVLEHLTQLTLTQTSYSVRDEALPSPLLWLPGLARLDFLHLQCHRYMDDRWLAQLLGTADDEAAAAPDVGCVGRLRWLGLRLHTHFVREATIRRWRRERCARLEQCAIRWLGFPLYVPSAHEAGFQLEPLDTDEEQLCSQRIDIAWQRQLCLQL